MNINVNFNTENLKDFLTAIETCKEMGYTVNSNVSQTPARENGEKGENEIRFNEKYGNARIKQSTIDNLGLTGNRENMFKQLFDGMESGEIVKGATGYKLTGEKQTAIEAPIDNDNGEDVY